MQVVIDQEECEDSDQDEWVTNDPESSEEDLGILIEIDRMDGITHLDWHYLDNSRRDKLAIILWVKHFTRIYYNKD